MPSSKTNTHQIGGDQQILIFYDYTQNGQKIERSDSLYIRAGETAVYNIDI
ncbi:MAG: hypothetical protein AAGI38_03510 [Bacteroidota bacterium]